MTSQTEIEIEKLEILANALEALAPENFQEYTAHQNLTRYYEAIGWGIYAKLHVSNVENSGLCDLFVSFQTQHLGFRYNCAWHQLRKELDSFWESNYQHFSTQAGYPVDHPVLTAGKAYSLGNLWQTPQDNQGKHTGRTDYCARRYQLARVTAEFLRDSIDRVKQRYIVSFAAPINQTQDKTSE